MLPVDELLSDLRIVGGCLLAFVDSRDAGVTADVWGGGGVLDITTGRAAKLNIHLPSETRNFP